MWDRVFWYFKQLFPLTYGTDYWTDGKHFVVYWKMFMGKCYDINEFEVLD